MKQLLFVSSKRTEKYPVPVYMHQNPMIPTTDKELDDSSTVLLEQGKICV